MLAVITVRQIGSRTRLRRRRQLQPLVCKARLPRKRRNAAPWRVVRASHSRGQARVGEYDHRAGSAAHVASLAMSSRVNGVRAMAARAWGGARIRPLASTPGTASRQRRPEPVLTATIRRTGQATQGTRVHVRRARRPNTGTQLSTTSKRSVGRPAPAFGELSDRAQHLLALPTACVRLEPSGRTADGTPTASTAGPH